MQEYLFSSGRIGRALLLSLAIGFTLEGPLGCRYLSVDPKENAVAFYEKFGFRYWTKNKRRMYLNMMDIVEQLEPKTDESLDTWWMWHQYDPQTKKDDLHS